MWTESIFCGYEDVSHMQNTVMIRKITFTFLSSIYFLVKCICKQMRLKIHD